MTFDWVNAIVAFAAVVAAIYSGSSYRKSKQLFRHQIMNDFFREFRADEMGHSVKMLWDFWRECGGNHEEFGNQVVRDRIVQAYGEAYHSQKQQDGTSLHEHRRRVSSFFQHIAILAQKEKEIASIVGEVWSKRDLQLIPEVFVPVEMEFLQKEINGVSITNPKEYPAYMKAMTWLYSNAGSERTDASFRFMNKQPVRLGRDGRYRLLLVATCAFFIVIPVAYFAIMGLIFGKTTLSDDTGVWGDFGSYLGGVLSTLIGFITFIFLYLNLQDEQRKALLRDQELREDQRKQDNIRVISEQKNEDQKKVNLLLTKCERLETKFDEAWERFSAHNDVYSDQLHRSINQRVQGTHPAIWAAADLLNLLCSLAEEISSVETSSDYPEYLVLRYRKSFAFYEGNMYTAELESMRLFTAKYLSDLVGKKFERPRH